MSQESTSERINVSFITTLYQFTVKKYNWSTVFPHLNIPYKFHTKS